MTPFALKDKEISNMKSISVGNEEMKDIPGKIDFGVQIRWSQLWLSAYKDKSTEINDELTSFEQN